MLVSCSRYNIVKKGSYFQKELLIQYLSILFNINDCNNMIVIRYLLFILIFTAVKGKNRKPLPVFSTTNFVRVFTETFHDF